MIPNPCLIVIEAVIGAKSRPGGSRATVGQCKMSRIVYVILSRYALDEDVEALAVTSMMRTRTRLQLAEAIEVTSAQTK